MGAKTQPTLHSVAQTSRVGCVWRCELNVEARLAGSVTRDTLGSGAEQHISDHTVA